MAALASHLVDENIVALAVGKSRRACARICIRWNASVKVARVCTGALIVARAAIALVDINIAIAVVVRVVATVEYVTPVGVFVDEGIITHPVRITCRASATVPIGYDGVVTRSGDARASTSRYP